MPEDLRLITQPEAEDELNAAALWYEEQSPGLSRRYLNAISATIRGIQRFPHAGARVPYVQMDAEIRRAIVKQFPYQVVYLLAPQAIYILAVAHDRREPGYWTERLHR